MHDEDKWWRTTLLLDLRRFLFLLGSVMSSCVVSDYSALSFVSPFAQSLSTAFAGFSFRKAEDNLTALSAEHEISVEAKTSEDKSLSTVERDAPLMDACDNGEQRDNKGSDDEEQDDLRLAYCKRIFTILNAVENWLFLDTEATGHRNSRIIEVGVVETDHQGRITGGTNFRCNPHDRSSRSAKRVHGIFDRELEHCYEFAHYAEELRDYLKGRVVIIHNAESDLEWLNAEFHRIDPTLPPIETLCTVVDSFELARMIPSERTRNGMDGLIEWYGFERPRRYHGGYDDAQMLAKVFRELWLDMQDFLEDEVA